MPVRPRSVRTFVFTATFGLLVGGCAEKPAETATPPAPPLSPGKSMPAVVGSTPAPSGFAPADRRGREAVANLGFEDGTLVGWSAEGDAFSGQPVDGDAIAARRPDMTSGHDGRFWVGTYERRGDEATGTLTSGPVTVEKPWCSFLVGGGAHPDTGVELVRADTQQVFFRASGDGSEGMKRVAVDLKDHQGKPVFIRVVDGSSGAWGHVNFDDFRFHDTMPEVDPAHVPASDATAPSPDREAAEMVLKRGGIAFIAVGTAPSQEVRQVEDLPNRPFRLKAVNLNGRPEVTDEDLRLLDGMGLDFCLLDGTGVTDAGLSSLRNVTGGVALNATKVTDAGLANLSDYQGRELFLTATGITDEGLKHLVGTRLEKIHFAGTGVTDAGLETLKQIPSLKHVGPAGAKVTQAGMDSFKASAPGRMID